MTKILTGKLLAATAFATMLAAGPVLAQDATTPPATDTPPAAAPATPATPADPAVPPAAGDPAAPAEVMPGTDAQAPATTDTDTATTTAVPTERFVTQQSTTDWLASNMVGSSVYDPNDENIGDINDLVTEESGQVKAVVIGVGGFLGIGEKDVAVNIDEISRTTDADGNNKFVLQTTKEELENAPEFKTLADLESETSAPASTGTGTGTGTTAPAGQM
ncbi:PRC-barrel domain-containing protein [Prosthecomicrobium pneumaticum]|uniref:Sporulation protein YlmC with PRC-barrel domain n=1 Tax=Prosthecomicrobium pneumaticum TaxID=81895 RepID=A0A7W9FR69_9HYPH|nr:PRC-barrel domain-containing protein [Prosthecomicrobium pneumaticum]MBB5755261.1 sporulation protein YlmC with PRC-barrel domain [Prosthecomicrobium pneumaticum]